MGENDNSLKTFLVITKHTEEDKKITTKFIIESFFRNTVFEYLKKDYKVIKIEETEAFEEEKETLGNIFKEQLAKYSQNNCEEGFINIKSKKILKMKS